MKANQIHLTLFSAFVILSVGVSAVRAQSTVFTYQGQVLDNGTNFTGTGQFKFALVASTNANHTATATANAPSGGYITGYNVTFVGNGYVTAPAVTVFGGGGSGAAATAHLTGDTVTSISVANTGDGNYTGAPTVTIAPPPPNISYTTYWSNDGTSTNGGEPTAAVSVNVANGLFTVVLGDTTIENMTPISASLFYQPNLQLRIWFNDGVNGSAALSPLQNLTSSPYASFATTTSNLLGTLPTSQLTGMFAANQLSGTAAAATNFTGNLAGDVTGTQNSTAVSMVGGLTATSIASGIGALSMATSADTPNTIVERDYSGSFQAYDLSLDGTLNLQNFPEIIFGGLPFVTAWGTHNAFIGVGAGAFNETGSNNAALGYYVLNGNNSGNGNTAMGYAALEQNTAGNNNTALGIGAGESIQGNYNIDIGNAGYVGDNAITRLGFAQTNVFIAGIWGQTIANGVPVYINSSWQLGTSTSSARFKKDIRNMDTSSDILYSLRPVTYHYKTEIDPQSTPQFGLVAEEVATIDPDLVVRDGSGLIYTVRYEAVNAMLLNEFLKEHKTVEAQNTEIQNLKRSLAELKAMVEKLAVK